MKRRADARRNGRDRTGEGLWKLAFDVIGARRAERQRIRRQVDLAYVVAAGFAGAVLAAVVMAPILGGTGAVVAAVVVGSMAAVLVSDRM